MTHPHLHSERADVFLQNFRMTEADDAFRGDFSLSLLHLGEQPNGAPYVLPVMVRNGAEPGPTTVLTAGIHGDEPLGNDVVGAVLRSIREEDVRGTVIGLPFVSYAAAATRSRRAIGEGYPGPHDLNRVFPGSESGTISERLAAFVVSRFLRRADFLFDIHTPALGGRWHPYAGLAEHADGLSDGVCAASNELARSFGAPVVIPHANTGTIVEAALRLNVAASFAEFGRAHLRDDESRELGVSGLRNVLRHTGNIAGGPGLPHTDLVVSRLVKIRAEHGGFLRLAVAPGEEVRQGQVLGAVEALDGQVVESVLAPVSGIVCRVSELAMVGTGEFVVYVGEVQR